MVHKTARFDVVIVGKNIQYEISNRITKNSAFKIENIHSGEWITSPPALRSLRPKTPVLFHFKAFIPHEREGDRDEMILLRAKSRRIIRSFVKFDSIGRIQRYRNKIAEQHGDVIAAGERVVTPSGQVTYDLKLTIPNVTQEHSGTYLCYIKREFDKLFILTDIAVYPQKSPLPEKPFVKLIPCHSSHYNDDKKLLTLYENRTTCIICRAIGYPLPLVNLIDTYSGKAFSDYHAEEFVNIAAAGVKESVYAIHKPIKRMHKKMFACRAVHPTKKDLVHSHQFSVVWVGKK